MKKRDIKNTGKKKKNLINTHTLILLFKAIGHRYEHQIHSTNTFTMNMCSQQNTFNTRKYSRTASQMFALFLHIKF